MSNQEKRNEVIKEESPGNFVKRIRPRQIILPIFIGLGIVFLLLYFQLKGNKIPFHLLKFTKYTALWLLIAALCMIIRDWGYIIRFKILSEGRVSWRQAFKVIMLWEFASAVSPSAVGGTGVAVIFVHKEGISIGRSSAIVMATSFLDELYFILMFPILVLSVNSDNLFNVKQTSSLANSFVYLAIIGYSIKLLYNIIIAYGLFKNPHIIKNIILRLFSLKLLRRWRKKARRAGLDIVKNSHELRKKPFKFWLKVFSATFVSWTARYWVVNAIFLAFFVVEKGHFLLFARQLVMWIMMLVSPTPGGSGFSEAVFSEYLFDFLPQTVGIAIIMAFIWRLFTYYPYLIAGIIIVPKWLKEKFVKTSK